MPINDRFSSYQKQWTSLDELMSANPDAVAAIEEFGDQYLIWIDDLAEANGYIAQANESTDGITIGKNGAKDTLSTSGSGQAGKGVSYAIRVGNDTLKAKMKKLTFSKLRH